MGLRSSGFYATVWEIRQGKGKYLDVRISTSKKDPKDNSQYITDYSGFARFVGKAKDFAQGLKEGDRIHVTEFEVTNSYNKEKNQTYTNIAVFAAEDGSFNRGGRNNSNSSPNPKTDSDGFMSVPDGVEDEGLPFN